MPPEQEDRIAECRRRGDRLRNLLAVAQIQVWEMKRRMDAESEMYQTLEDQDQEGEAQ